MTDVFHRFAKIVENCAAFLSKTRKIRRNAGKFSTNFQNLRKTPRIETRRRRKLSAGVMDLSDDKTPALRLEPEKRLCPEFDPETIARYRVAAPGEMGFRVLDNFCEEHIQ